MSTELKKIAEAYNILNESILSEDRLKEIGMASQPVKQQQSNSIVDTYMKEVVDSFVGMKVYKTDNTYVLSKTERDFSFVVELEPVEYDKESFSIYVDMRINMSADEGTKTVVAYASQDASTIIVASVKTTPSKTADELKGHIENVIENYGKIVVKNLEDLAKIEVK